MDNYSNLNGHGHGIPSSVPNVTTTTIVIRRLPRGITYDQLLNMLVFARDLQRYEIVDSDYAADGDLPCAIVMFKSRQAAESAKAMLHGKTAPSCSVDMIVEIAGESPPPCPPALRRNTIHFPKYQAPVPQSQSQPQLQGPSSSAFPPPGPSRALSDWEYLRHSLASTTATAQDSITTAAATVATTTAGLANNPGTGLPAPNSNSRLNSIFQSPSPANGHRAQGPRVSGKSVIGQDRDEDAGELLNDTITFARNGLSASEPLLSRRATSPNPINTTIALSNVNVNGLSSASPYMNGGPQSAGGTMVGNSGNMAGLGHQQTNNHTQGRTTSFPAANPADQNPPCNTLYVGNLPRDVRQEELRDLFQRLRGFRRMLYRWKNGPICLVEFENVSFATKCLHELYGCELSNSVKGGIRLSFAKNPLGVRRSNTGNGTTTGSGNINGNGNGHTNGNGVPQGNGNLHQNSLNHMVPSMPVMYGAVNGFDPAMSAPRFSNTRGPPPGLPSQPGAISYGLTYTY